MKLFYYCQTLTIISRKNSPLSCLDLYSVQRPQRTARINSCLPILSINGVRRKRPPLTVGVVNGHWPPDRQLCTDGDRAFFRLLPDSELPDVQINSQKVANAAAQHEAVPDSVVVRDPLADVEDNP